MNGNEGSGRRYTAADVYHRLGGIEAKIDGLAENAANARLDHDALAEKVNAVERRQARYTGMAVVLSTVGGYVVAKWEIVKGVFA